MAKLSFPGERKMLAAEQKERERIRKSWAASQAQVDREWKEIEGKESAMSNEAGEQGDTLLTEIESFLAQFVIYPSSHARAAHVLWIAHTHLMQAWDSTPRIAFLSPEPSSGKTRALEITELLVPVPIMAVNVSAAYLFRKVGDTGNKPTVLFDEIDTIFGAKAKEHEDIRGLLNAGHRRGAVAGRCVVRGKTIETEEIPAYCAVALAGLGWLPDTILSRSVIIRMRKRKAEEKVWPFRRRTYEAEGHALRDRLANWANGIEINGWPDMPNGIEDRNADMWEALVAVANEAGGDWPEKARQAATAFVKAARDIEPSLGIRLLADLKNVFGDAKEMPTETILTALHSLKEAPWNDLKGRPLNDRGLAQRLRHYEIKPAVLTGGKQRGYHRTDLHDAWERYLPPSPPATSVTSVTSVIGEERANHFNGETVTLDVTDGEDAANASVTAATVTLVENSDVTKTAPEAAANVSKINCVTGVTLVTHLPGTEGRPISAGPTLLCLQCGAPIRHGMEITVCSTGDGQLASVHQNCLSEWQEKGPPQ
jgi:hypothetical protein